MTRTISLVVAVVVSDGQAREQRWREVPDESVRRGAAVTACE
jgi:hypothetical protein